MNTLRLPGRVAHVRFGSVRPHAPSGRLQRGQTSPQRPLHVALATSGLGARLGEDRRQQGGGNAWAGLEWRQILRRVSTCALLVVAMAFSALVGLFGGHAKAQEEEPLPSSPEDNLVKVASRFMDEEDRSKRTRNWTPLNDPFKSMATDYSDSPTTEEAINEHNIQTAWRTENLKDLSYTQMLILVREGHVESVRFKQGMRVMEVTTRESAPGRGRGIEEVGLVYDPKLYDYLCAHGVEIEVDGLEGMEGIQYGIVRLFGPVVLALTVVAWTLTLGRAPARNDEIFGGSQMELITKADVRTTFKDVAGMDDIKDEIMEVVSFLKNQDAYLALGAKSPGGVLLCGPPGMGKTLLAKAIAGEANVPFYSTAGSDFSNMFVGVGASRVRDMFVRARKNAPCILFIDEFDGVGQARSQDMSGNDDSAQTINQLLTEMDGFEDNTGVVVLAATNRPHALDEALTRPGRFDRIITIPYPNLAGRIEILKVHARDKAIEPSVSFQRIARATAGSSGAELMQIMNTAAIESVQQQRRVINEDDIFTAMEKVQNEKFGLLGYHTQAADDGDVTPLLRRIIATYVASKGLMGLITPDYDELQKMVVTPDGRPTGYCYFIPQDSRLESRIITRCFMEGSMVVSMAGRVGEVAVMGAANMTAAGGKDIEYANELARDMILRYGWSTTLGPINITEEEVGMSNEVESTSLANMSPNLASQAMSEMQDKMLAAEAKAYFGLVCNWELLSAMVDRMMKAEGHMISRTEIEALTEKYPLVMFKDSFVDGFYFDKEHRLHWPSSYDDLVPGAEDTATGRRSKVPLVKYVAKRDPDVHPLNPYEPDGSYVPMGSDFLGADAMYFKPEAWSDGVVDVGGGNGASSTSDTREPTAAGS